MIFKFLIKSQKACKFAYSNEPSRDGIGEWQGKTGKTILYEGMVDSCPAGIEYSWEAYWNAGKMWIARAILTGDLEFTEEVRDVFMPCITCGQCAAQCENKIPTVDIIESLRAACSESGVPMIDKHQLIDRIVKEKNNPYGGAANERMKWAKDAGLEKFINNKGAKIAYYVGCTASYRQIEVAIATAKLFEQLGLNFTLIEEEVCCGSPFFRIGAVETAQELMRKNLEVFKDMDILYFSCAGCYRTLTIDYPKWMNKDEKLPFKTKHAFELIAELVTKEKIKFKSNKELKGKVITYHDPCHTGRHFALDFEQRMIQQSKNLMFDMRKISQEVDKWFDKPRIILRKLVEDVGLVFNEMYRIKLNSMCCGAGGGVRAGYPDFSIRTSSLRCDEANAVGAEFLLTECPFCWRNLFDANNLYDHKLIVMGILQMISEYGILDIVEKPTLKDILNTETSLL
ncbi:MAG: (Fe-S)-binding protein [Promethearchaeota archaeon]